MNKPLIEFCFDCNSEYERFDPSKGCCKCASMRNVTEEDLTDEFFRFLEARKWRRIEEWVYKDKLRPEDPVYIKEARDAHIKGMIDLLKETCLDEDYLEETTTKG